MSGSRQGPALDRFRLLAAVLVVCNHTGPLDSLSPTADFFLTRVLARLAVPFFFIVSGYFLAKGQWKHTGRFLRKTLLLYLAAVALYLPLNWYNGGYSPLEWVKKLLADGTLYHLWYFPAVLLGVVVARNLARLPHSAALGVAAVLYLIGVGGDSWYGLVSQAPALEELYGGIFQVFDLPATACSSPLSSSCWGRQGYSGAAGPPPGVWRAPSPLWRRRPFSCEAKAGPGMTACT